MATARTTLAVVTPFDVARVASSPFGVMTHFAQHWDPVIIPLISLAGIKNVRDEVYWDQVEPEPGQFVFPSVFDTYMADLKAQGIDSLTPLTFSNHNYDGGKTPYTQAGFDAYARYCQEVLKDYGNQIHSVEIWNEYNGSFADGPAAQDRSATYVKMLKTAYPAIKAVRPDVTVLGCSTAGVPLPYLEKIFKAGGLQFMDAISVHPYRYDSAPEGLEKQIAHLQSLAEEYNGGRPKPIWVTEEGWFIKDKTQPGEMPITEADQAKFVVRAYTLLLSAGVSKIFWYLFRDYSTFATMGLIHGPDDPAGAYTPKPSYVAMAVMTRQLTGWRYVKRDDTLAGVYSLVFRSDATGGNLRVMWSPGPDPITLSIHARSPLTIVDMMGMQHMATPDGGIVTLHLSDAPIYLKGTVESLPPPGPSMPVLADSSDQFSDTQGKNQWSYGYFESGATPGPYTSSGFKLLPTYRVTDWQDEWVGAPQWLSITADQQHPDVDNGHQLWAVRRWVSNVSGEIDISGEFSGGTQGDGIDGRIFVDGAPVFAQQLGSGHMVSAKFDVKAAVHPGSTVDFAVDPGPALDTSYDATNVSVVITLAGK